MTTTEASRRTAEAEAPDAPRGRASGWRFPRLPFAVGALILTGVLTVLYPTVSAWFHQHQQSQIIVDLRGGIQQLAPEGREEILQEAREYNATLTSGALVGAFTNIPKAEGYDGTANGRVLPYAEQLVASSTGLMARLKIPSINLDLPVYHGTSDEVLLEGIGHLEGTALPVGGRGTHAVLTGHRGLAEAELFTNLNHVQVGDTFSIDVFGEVLTYQVRQTQVVEPTDTESLYPFIGEDLVTLVTCTPLGINTQRILVTGERITPTPIEDVAAMGANPDIPGPPWWIAIIVAAVVGVSYYVYPSGKPRKTKARRVHPQE